MGQYYNPIILGDPAEVEVILLWLDKYKYGSCSKMMEQACVYPSHTLVPTFETLIAPGAKYYKSRVVWAGDYAEEEPGLEKNLYHLCKPELEVEVEQTNKEQYRYLVNHTQRKYVDKHAVRAFSRYGDNLHVLPLLTAEGNGAGMGDFDGDDPGDVVGSWARDVISVESEIPEGFAELTVVLQEE